jgi:heptose I phosphotransferase
MGFETLDHGRIVAAPEFLPLLRDGGLDTFEKVMAFAGGRVMREFPGRRTVRIEIQARDGTNQAIYLKRYLPHYLSAGRRWLRALHWPGAGDEAMREWETIHAVRGAGIQTAIPIAAGQGKSGGVVTRSFLMTAEVEGGVEGDHHLRAVAAPTRRELLRGIADLTRRFHAAGFIHKDYYLCHVLVAPGEPEPGLFLIDLQRVVQPCCLRRRWLVKDLAALAYSGLKSGASRADLRAAYRRYRGQAKLTREDRILARAILRRVAWLRTRTPKHDTGFQQLA